MTMAEAVVGSFPAAEGRPGRAHQAPEWPADIFNGRQTSPGRSRKHFCIRWLWPTQDREIFYKNGRFIKTWVRRQRRKGHSTPAFRSRLTPKGNVTGRSGNNRLKSSITTDIQDRVPDVGAPWAVCVAPRTHQEP